MSLRVALLGVLVGCAPKSPVQTDPPAPQAAIDVSFGAGVPESARQAIHRAAKTWSDALVLSTPIRVRVDWIVGNGPTGFALPNAVHRRDVAELTGPDALVPSPLADHLVGRDLQPDEPDMHIFFKEQDSWCYSGEPTSDETHFETSALHEIGHGLGITTAAFVPWEGEKEASFGMPNEYLSFFDFAFELPELDGTATVYDQRVVDAEGRRLTDPSVFPNPSEALYDGLKGPLFFDGPISTAANGGRRVALDSGSVSHLARSGVAETSPDWAMVPDTGHGRAHVTPGPLTLAVMEDLGWTLR